MAKEKFIYNTQTLQYDKVTVSNKEILLKRFGFISSFIVAVFLGMMVFSRLLPTSFTQDKRLANENDQLRVELSKLSKSVDLMGKAVSNVEERDSSVYRMLLMMEPPTKNGYGSGGHDRYLNLAKYPSTEAILTLQEKIDRISQQIIAESNSMETLRKLTKEKDKIYASLPSIKPVREDKLNRDMNLLSGFGMRFHPIHHAWKLHKGMDFSSPSGTAILATADGEIGKAGKESGYGNCVTINHGYGYETLYGHMSRVDVKPGQKVKKGQQIGLVGSTGNSTGPHCHYEVHLNGKIVNPIDFCRDGMTPEEYQALADASKIANKSFD
jgi:hypothetical protein